MPQWVTQVALMQLSAAPCCEAHFAQIFHQRLVAHGGHADGQRAVQRLIEHCVAEAKAADVRVLLQGRAGCCGAAGWRSESSWAVANGWGGKSGAFEH